MNLYLLRHGQTEHSRQDRFCGRLDVELTDAGHEMAQAFVRSYGGRDWRAIYTSTRRRAIQTAAPLSRSTGLPILQDGRLDEIDYGGWQGRSKSELMQMDPERYRSWCDDPTIGAPGGETAIAVAARVRAVVNDLAARHPDGDVLLVSHKTALRVLICQLVGMELRSYRTAVTQPVGGVTIIELRPEGATLRALGDTRHLVTSELGFKPGPATGVVPSASSEQPLSAA